MIWKLATISGGGSILAVFLVVLTSCVGPTTPLGAVDNPLTPEPVPARVQTTVIKPHDPLGNELSVIKAESPPVKASIEFYPPYQQVHAPYSWRVVIRDPMSESVPDPTQVRIFYNDLAVSESARFLFVAEPRFDPRDGTGELILEMSKVRLGILDEHQIRVEYTTTSGKIISNHYEFPRITNFEKEEEVADTGPFDADPEILNIIYNASREFSVNPVLLAALIAQESGFNPYALSKAKALGLTQVTHLTERDIIKRFKDWPRYPGIRKYSRRSLRKLIPKEINGENEWRLDPVKSIWGGAYYLSYLRDRVTHQSNAKYLIQVEGEHEQVVTEAVLAAYNSGLNRTLYLMGRYGNKWLEYRKIQEAKSYIRKIMSFYGDFKTRVPGKS